ncbi:neuronal acetylcholine receptor subunit alpha-7-like [Pomacea canaliculata]|uniref:neuronal acetylcholine receptor subunit alpha-7-like n=1 Tax=Pomacea canaliculata TaxID=400727 RepID=UPI000D7303C9|nr:neuronal acetylcholine receptor subunit alpha-7-like [Pomacea canaliculata]
MNVRPYYNHTEAIQVSVGLDLLNILELNEEDEVLETYAIIMQSWHDFRLEWNYTQYADVTEVRVPSSKVWKPDIVPYNSLDTDKNLADTTVSVFASGHVIWFAPLRLRTICRVDLHTFPFDEQQCALYFASWTHHGNQLNLSLWGDNSGAAFKVESEATNNEWTVVKREAEIRSKYYSCCLESFPDFIVTLTLRRNPLFYVHVFIIPALLIGLLVPFHMLLPPDSSERITLGSILMALLLLLIIKLQDVLPNAHAELPAIGRYVSSYTLSLLWSVLALLSSMVVLNLHSRAPRRGKVPDTIRWIFLRSLKRLVCLGSDTYYLLNDLETISMRGLDQPKTSLTTSSVTCDRRDQPAAMDMRCSPRLEREVEEVSRQLHLLTARAHLQDSRTEVINEWRLVGLVLDRLLFFVFLLIYLMCAVIVLA